MLLLNFTKAFSAIFVVTSNADSGPGTLRDALTQAAANGSATQDIIQFNLADQSIAGRTITLITQLPYVSSNLVIDGTTQPGANLGRSDAKITLQPADPVNSAFNGLVLLDADGVQIYGLYIRDFVARVYYSPQESVPYIAAAVYAETSSNLQIGAPGKGNVFANNGFAVTTFGTSLKDQSSPVSFGIKNLKFYSNFVEYEPDGKTYRGTYPWLNGGGVALNYCSGDIRIGDDVVATRNFFGNGSAVIGAASGGTLYQSTILIKNNYFSYDVDGNPSAIVNVNTGTVNAVYLAQYSPTENLDYPYTVNIIGNKFQWSYAIACGHITGDFTMQGNTVALEPSVAHPAYTGGIGATSDGNILIGGVNPGEANSLYGGEIDLFSRKSVLLQHNSIYCVSDFRGIWYPNVPYLDPPLPLPVVAITQVTAQSVSGTATPLSKVELFFDDDCYYCEPLTYITTVNADANGNWQYNGPIVKGVIASSTINGFTSLFTKHAVYVGGKITYSSCGNGGSITGTVFQNTGGYQWKNDKGDIVGTNSEITGLKPGNYTLTALNGTCSRDYPFAILDATPKINESNKLVTQPSSCSSNIGSVTGLYLDNSDVLNAANSSGDYNVYTYKWVDAGGNTVSTSIDLINVPVGTYHLDVSYKNQCTVTYGPVTLSNLPGLAVDHTQVKIVASDCTKADGSITNLAVTGTGTIKYSWKNSQQQEIATTKDLINQLPGDYTVQISDDSQCDPFTFTFEIPNFSGVTMDYSYAKITMATCGESNGSITGIIETGAIKLTWVNDMGTVVGHNVDLTNVPGGNYQLTIANDCGNTLQSQVFHLDGGNKTIYPGYNAAITNVCPNNSNGSISITVDALVKSARWINSQGATVGNTTDLSNVQAGVYGLYLTDQNGCETFYNNFTVDEISPIQILQSSAQIVNIQCHIGLGSITGIKIAGGQLPYSYTWTDAGGNLIASTPDITGLAAGDYTLTVKDARDCNLASGTYTIQDIEIIIPAPSAANIDLCSPGEAFLMVTNPSPGYTYQLYNNDNDPTPIDTQPNGKFKINAQSNIKYYVSAATGSCESPRTEVSVTVGISGINIANTITPNGDGINDYWNITGIQNYPTSLVQIFTRYGQKVFESKGYSHPFDGTSNGTPLPVGVYYYIINLNTNCNLFSGSLTIIR